MAPARNGPGKALDAVVQHPVLRLVFGILTAALGAVVIFWPGHPVPIVSILFGVQLILSSVFRFIAALGTEAAPWVRGVNLVAGVIAVIAGLFFLRHPYSLATGAFLLGLLLGIYWVVTGVIDLFTVLTHHHLRGRGTTALAAALSLVAGIIVLADPSVSVNVIAWVLGGFLFVLGVITIVQALLLRQRRERTVVRSPAR